MVVLDTNIIIEHLRLSSGKSSLYKLTEDNSRLNLGISLITIQELFVGQSTKDPQSRKKLKQVIKPLLLLPYNEEIATKAGELMRDYSPLTFADAAIAATTILHEAKLFTLNTKDFSKLPSLQLLEI